MKQGEKKRPYTLAWGLTIAIVSFVAGTRYEQILEMVAPTFGVRYSAERLEAGRIQETYRQLNSNYDGELDTEALIDGANRGLVAAAGDLHTSYMNRDEVAEFEKSMRGDIGGGIGAEIGLRNQRPTIIRPLKNSPAEKAGIKAGDVIVGVNDEFVMNLSVDEVVAKIRGEIGTSVRLKLRRSNEDQEFSITRQQVVAPTVESEVADGIGILKISRFNDEAGSLARAAAENFKQQGVSKVIVDLRGNPGGTVSSAQAVAGLWLDRQEIMSERRGEKAIKTVKSSGQPILADIKTVVLIDEGSASASEIIAGSLRDYGKATLVGEKSYGKGSVQKLITLSGGAQLKVTEARWFTPKGVNIDKVGIEPDEKVELTSDDVNNNRDPQMDRAKQL